MAIQDYLTLSHLRKAVATITQRISKTENELTRGFNQINSRITNLPQPDWNASEGNNGYIKNRTHYIEKGENVIINPQIFEADSSGKAQLFFSPDIHSTLLKAENVTITYNGEPFESSSFYGYFSADDWELNVSRYNGVNFTFFTESFPKYFVLGITINNVTAYKKLDSQYLDGALPSKGVKDYSESFNSNNMAIGEYSHAEGSFSIANGNCSHAENSSFAHGASSHSEGEKHSFGISISGEAGATTFTYTQNLVEDCTGTVARYYPSSLDICAYILVVSHDMVNKTITFESPLSYQAINNEYIGFYTGATGDYSHSEGGSTISSGMYSHSEGYSTKALGNSSHSEGSVTKAIGSYSHAEGNHTVAEGFDSHSEGMYTSAIGRASHVENGFVNDGNHGLSLIGDAGATTYTVNKIYGINPSRSLLHFYVSGSEVIGETFSSTGRLNTITLSNTLNKYNKVEAGRFWEVCGNIASGASSHAEGYLTEAAGDYSHSEGVHTIAAGLRQHVQGVHNVKDTQNKYAHIVGNGTDTSPSNAYTLDWSGNGVYAGKLTVGAAPTNTMDVATKKYVDDATSGITSDLVGLTDTTITSPTNGQFLQYNSSTSKWENKTYTAPVTSVNGQTGAVTVAVPTKTSDLTNDSGFMTGMTILAYGSSSWADFIDAYVNKRVVYCRASSNSNPASGSQTRLAFMAYVNDAENPTNVEFQYYRSVSSHSNTQQGDQVYVYKLDKSSGWSVTVRENYTKVVAGTGLSSNWASGAITLSLSSTIPSASSSTPQDLGTASAGSSTDYSRSDHVHALPTLSISSNVITLTGASGQTTSVTLPVYNGGVSSS